MQPFVPESLPPLGLDWEALIPLIGRAKETIELTRTQYAVPMLDRIFERPIFRSTDLTDQEDMPSKQMVMSMLSKLKEAGVLKVLRKGSGRRPQVLALAELINLCEGRQAI